MRIPLPSLSLALALSGVVGAARGDVVVTGTLDHLQIEANQAPIVEVLEALKSKFGIAYQYRAGPQWTADGVFSGSLSTILPQIFRNKNYAYRTGADNSVTVFFLSAQGPAPDPPTAPPPVAAVMIGGDPAGKPVPGANRTKPARH